MNETKQNFINFELSEKAVAKFKNVGDPKGFFLWLIFKNSVKDTIECIEYKGLTFLIEELEKNNDSEGHVKNYSSEAIVSDDELLFDKSKFDVFICFDKI